MPVGSASSWESKQRGGNAAVSPVFLLFGSSKKRRKPWMSVSVLGHGAPECRYLALLWRGGLQRRWFPVRQDSRFDSVKSAFYYFPFFPSDTCIPWVSWRKVWQASTCTCAVASWGLCVQGGCFKVKYSTRIYGAINSWQDGKLFSTNASLTTQLKELLVCLYRLRRLHGYQYIFFVGVRFVFFFQEKVAFICVGGSSYILLTYLFIQFTRKNCIPEV